MTEEEERKAAEAIKVDIDLYGYLTEEILEGYLPILFNIELAEGDFIRQFDKKARGIGIPVHSCLVDRLLKDKKPVHGIDLRSGEYGIVYAGMGFYHAGRQYFDKGDMENALLNLEKSIELFPWNIMAYSLKRQIHLKSGHKWLAAAEAENAIRLNPISIAEKDSASREILEKSGEGFREFLSDELVHAYYSRGLLLYNLKLREEALADFNETIKRDPEHREGLFMRLMTYMHLGRLKEALADADALLAAGYEPEKTRKLRGMVLRMLGRCFEAILEFNKIIAINPHLDSVYLHRAICYLEKELYENAINDASEAIKDNKPHAYYYRAKAYLYSGEYTKAIDDFDAALLRGYDSEEIKGLREMAVEHKTKGIIAHYYRQNEKGEWEYVGNCDGALVLTISAPNYQNYLDECRKEEAKYVY